jgi:hypothetical protein
MSSSSKLLASLLLTPSPQLAVTAIHLGRRFGPPLVTFGAPLHALAGCLEGHPLTAIGDCLPVALDKNDSNHLLTKGIE